MHLLTHQESLGSTFGDMLLKRQLSFFSLSSTSILGGGGSQEGVLYTRVDSPVNFSPSDSLYSSSESVQLQGDHHTPSHTLSHIFSQTLSHVSSLTHPQIPFLVYYLTHSLSHFPLTTIRLYPRTWARPSLSFLSKTQHFKTASAGTRARSKSRAVY